jgi:hypothetical protein
MGEKTERFLIEGRINIVLGKIVLVTGRETEIDWLSKHYCN